MIVSRSDLIRLRNVYENCCRENQNTHFTFKNFPYFFLGGGGLGVWGVRAANEIM